jgi:7-cyano-7-deazaguanine synthase
MADTSESAVVLLSGGIDSTVLLHHVVKNLECSPIHVLSFHYGQRHAKELECAARQAALLRVAKHERVDISFLGPLLEKKSTLLQGGAPVPDLADIDVEKRSQPPTYVPNRNMILLSIAAAYAEANDAFSVFYGAQAQDEYGYWDCTTSFLERINQLLQLNRERPVTIRAPFVSLKKEEVIRLGHELHVDFSQTWSCYRGGTFACGKCPTCIERLNAFSAGGFVDPIPYEAGKKGKD